jgi:hypothetical protein
MSSEEESFSLLEEDQHDDAPLRGLVGEGKGSSDSNTHATQGDKGNGGKNHRSTTESLFGLIDTEIGSTSMVKKPTMHMRTDRENKTALMSNVFVIPSNSKK